MGRRKELRDVTMGFAAQAKLMSLLNVLNETRLANPKDVDLDLELAKIYTAQNDLGQAFES